MLALWGPAAVTFLLHFPHDYEILCSANKNMLQRARRGRKKTTLILISECCFNRFTSQTSSYVVVAGETVSGPNRPAGDLICPTDFV